MSSSDRESVVACDAVTFAMTVGWRLCACEGLVQGLRRLISVPNLELIQPHDRLLVC